MPYQLWSTLGLQPEGQLNTFDKRMLSRFRSKTVYAKFGFQRGIPMHGGKSISFRRMEAIPAASYAITTSSQILNMPASQGGPGVAYASGGWLTPAYGSGPLALTEGTPGAPIDLSFTQVLATVSQYGNYVQVTDLAETQSIDDIMAETTENFADAMTEAIDLVTRDILSAGTNVQYASTATTRATVGSGMNLTLAELREAKRTLLSGNARTIGGDGGNKYVLITHPHALYDLEGDSNVTNIWQYAGVRGDSNQLFDVAFSDLPFGVRVINTTLCRIFASLGLSGADVYGSLLFGDEWYGTVPLDALPARVIKHERGSSGVFDPLDQVGTIGWKCAWAAVILNQTLGVRIEHNATAKQAA